MKKMENNLIIVVHTFLDSEEKAREISRQLLDEKLIACSNLFPCASLYQWDGKMQDEREIVVSLKASTAVKERLVRRLEALHPYDVPAIFVERVEASENFSAWINESCL